MATIEVDDALLDRVLEVTGQRTYAEVVTDALEEILRVNRLRRGLQELQELGESAFHPDFLAEMDAREGAQRVTASEHRLPRKRKSARGDAGRK